MQYFNFNFYENSYLYAKTLNQEIDSYTWEWCGIHKNYQLKKVFIEANSAINCGNTSQSDAHTVSTTCASPASQSSVRSDVSQTPLRQMSGLDHSKRSRLSLLLSQSPFLKRKFYSRSFSQSTLDQKGSRCLPVLTCTALALRNDVRSDNSGKTIPRQIGKLVNQLMRHGKKGIAIGLLARSLSLFFKRIQENKSIPSLASLPASLTLASLRDARVSDANDRRQEQSRILLPQTFIGEKSVPAFPFFTTSLLTQNEIGQSSQLLGSYPQNRALSLYADQRVAENPMHYWQHLPPFRGSVIQEVMPPKERRALPPGKTLILSSLRDATDAQYRREVLTTLSRSDKGNRNSSNKMGLDGRPLYRRGLKPLSSAAFHPHVKNSLFVSNNLQKSPVHHEIMPRKEILFPGASPVAANRPQKKGFVIDYVEAAIANIEPSLEVRRKKIAGITRQIPSAVPKLRGENLAIRWLVESARNKVRVRGKNLSESLADELIDAYTCRGEPWQRRDFLHKQAESNRSFMRYRWW